MARRIFPQQTQAIQVRLYYGGEVFNVPTPVNWRTANKEIARSKFYHGFISAISDDIIFSGYSADLIREWYDTDGVIANIAIQEFELSDEDDDWTLVFSGTLDLSNFKYEDSTISIKVTPDTLQKKLSSRYQTQISIDDPTTLDGVTHGLGRVPRYNIDLRTRNISGESLLSIGTPYDQKPRKEAGENLVLLTNRNESYNGDLPRTFTIGNDIYIPNAPKVENFFFYNQQDLINFDGSPKPIVANFKFEFEAEFALPDGEGGGETFELLLDCYDVAFQTDGTATYTKAWVSPRRLLTHTFVAGEQTTLSFNKIETVEQCYPHQAFVWYMNEGLGGLSDPDWTYRITKGDVTVEGPVEGSGTKADTILPFNFFERMNKMIGGGILESDYLSQSRVAITNGYMIRNVIDKETQLPPPVIYTFEKLYHSFDSLYPLGLAVDGNTMKIEKRDYFYQDFISYDFETGVSNVSYEFDKEQAYSEMAIGFESSNFSREGALKEVCVKTTWVSPINTYKVELNMVSNMQGSSNTIETLRRVQYQEDVERSHTRQGDSTMYVIDLREANDQINPPNTPREYGDDFEQQPEFVPYPDDVFNLRLTPANRVRNFGKWVNYGYTKFIEKYLTFSSSTGATGMITIPNGEAARSESDSILISDLDNAVYISETVTFNIEPLNFFKILKEKINGVYKMYGIFRFEYNGEIVFGYLMSYKIDTYEIELQIKRKVKIT